MKSHSKNPNFPTFSKDANKVNSWMFMEMSHKEQELLLKEAEVFHDLYRAIALRGGFVAGLERQR